MARALSDAGIAAEYSYAGRTGTPVAQPLPVRIGGFGGADGLRDYLRAGGFSHLVDATHPFAAQISCNAVAACAGRTPLIALERAPWAAGPGDDWVHVTDIAAAARALPDTPARVFLAIGRQNLGAFAGLQHRWLLRLVDAPTAPPLPGATVIVARGPFTRDEDLALMRDHATQIVVAKNAGGEGARAKIDAARDLELRVVMIDRPELPDRPRVETPGDVLRWLHADLGV